VFMQSLIADEGLKLRPYIDTVGKITIGCGRNLTDKGISQQEAIGLLKNDIAECVTHLEGFAWFAGLDEVRQHVVLNMRFQLGPSRFLGFRQMLSAIEHGDYAAAAEAMLDSLWAGQVPARAHRLSDEMRTGVMHG